MDNGSDNPPDMSYERVFCSLSAAAARSMSRYRPGRSDGSRSTAAGRFELFFSGARRFTTWTGISTKHVKGALAEKMQMYRNC